MPRIIPTATHTPDDGYAWPVQPRLRMPIGLVAQALAIEHGRPGGRVIGKEKIRPAVLRLVEQRVLAPSQPEQAVPADVLHAWASWLVKRGIFPQKALDDAPDLAETLP